MAITPESRTAAEMIIGSLVYFVPDGTSITRADETLTTSRTVAPTMAEATTVGKIMGQISKFAMGVEYKTLTRKGVNPSTQRYEDRDIRTIQKVKPTFSTNDVTPDAIAMEYGLTELPAINASAQPFSNASGYVRGYLVFIILDSYRTSGEDGELAKLLLRGDLGLAEATENNDELKEVNYEFSVTDFPKDGFFNVAISAELAN